MSDNKDAEYREEIELLKKENESLKKEMEVMKKYSALLLSNNRKLQSLLKEAKPIIIHAGVNLGSRDVAQRWLYELELLK